MRKSKASRDLYTPPGSVDRFVNNHLVQPGSWRNNNRETCFAPLQAVPRRAAINALETRMNFMNYIYEKYY
ncbi:hypothetical protein NQ314_001782 [Rhamnusium bicolor]|uniref:Uncharacterized protein n=1 Tax=Rhamnusium bicolor TaxID=1586634 RepID=A0AAV8ZT88_9CUCU|nr:hypothetical protein NQ314_001782 [Rhamnusium bicolor]